jgi:hypothetical protein
LASAVEACQEQTRGNNRQNRSTGTSGNGDSGSTPEDQSSDTGAVGSEGDANTKFAAALGGEVGDDSEDADGGKSESDESKAAEQKDGLKIKETVRLSSA